MYKIIIDILQGKIKTNELANLTFIQSYKKTEHKTKKYPFAFSLSLTIRLNGEVIKNIVNIIKNNCVEGDIGYIKIVYLGVRYHQFKKFIRSILRMSYIANSSIERLLNYEGVMKIYNSVFTHPSADITNNYEFYEFVGDVIVNKAIVKFLVNRFPSLNKSDGVEVLTPLKQELISKRYFADLGAKLGFWKYISIDINYKKTEMKRTLEDCFEAFFGATEWMFANILRRKDSDLLCSYIIASILKNEPIPTTYETIVNPISRLKELFDTYADITKSKESYMKKIEDRELPLISRVQVENDYVLFQKKAETVRSVFPNGLGKLEYKVEHMKNELGMHFMYQISVTANGIVLGRGMAPLKQDAKKKAAQEGINYLKTINIEKSKPSVYDDM